MWSLSLLLCFRPLAVLADFGLCRTICLNIIICSLQQVTLTACVSPLVLKYDRYICHLFRDYHQDSTLIPVGRPILWAGPAHVPHPTPDHAPKNPISIPACNYHNITRTSCTSECCNKGAISHFTSIGSTDPSGSLRDQSTPLEAVEWVEAEKLNQRLRIYSALKSDSLIRFQISCWTPWRENL